MARYIIAGYFFALFIGNKKPSKNWAFCLLNVIASQCLSITFNKRLKLVKH